MTKTPFVNVSMDSSEDTVDRTLSACVQRWIHLKDDVAQKKWRELSPEMVADFVRSTAYTLIEQFGKEDAAFKATEMFSCLLASFNKSSFSLSGIWMPGDASVRLTFMREKDQGLDASEPDASTPSKPGHSPVALPEALRPYPEVQAEPRFVFDPLKSLPDREIRAITGLVEDLLSDTTRVDRDILVGAATVLLVWQMLEDKNIPSGNMFFSGMRKNEEMLWEGDKMVISFKASLFDKLAQDKTWTPVVWDDPVSDSETEVVAQPVTPSKPKFNAN